MSFLQPGYKVPDAPSSYMRLKQGANKFRILSHCLTGWEYWNKENKPVRQSEPFDMIPADIKIEPNGQPQYVLH